MARANHWAVTDRELFQRLRRLRETGRPAALATVVDVAGSAYRRPGAKLLATEEDRFGAVTAGCLDGPVAELAADARESGTVTVETFDLTDDDWGLGLGCNGVIDILVEPLDDSIAPIITALDRGETATAVTVLDSDDEVVPVGARAVVTSAGIESGSDRATIPADIAEELRDVADSARATGTSTARTVQRDAGDLRVFVDGIQPAPELLLFGAQQDIHPIARVGAQAGFRVTVASPRGGRADSEQFPHANRVSATHPTEISDLVDDPERTYAVLVSHNLVDDRLALDCLLTDTDVPYIGLMGPRERFKELRAAADRTFSQSDIDRIATPVGLDLGDGTPMGVALSVVSEVLAVSNDADGGPLSERSGPIHPRPDLSG